MLHSNSPHSVSNAGTTTLTRYHRLISRRRDRNNLPDVYLLVIHKALSVCYPSSSSSIYDGCPDSRDTARRYTAFQPTLLYAVKADHRSSVLFFNNWGLGLNMKLLVSCWPHSLFSL